MTKIGRGWAPEYIIDDKELFAVRELRILLDKIFTTKHNQGRLSDGSTRRKL